MDSDSSVTSIEESDNTPDPKRPRTSPRLATMSATSSSMTPASASSKVKERFTNSIEKIDEQIHLLKELRGSGNLAREDKINVLFVYFGLYREYVEKKKKHKGRLGPANIQERTAAILKRSKHVVADIVKGWTDGAASADMREAAVEESGQRGNFKEKQSRVPHTKKVYFQLRDFVREKRQNRERVTGAQILDHLASEQVVTIKSTNNIADAKDYKAALRAVQRYLIRRGFQRGKRTGNISINEDHIAWRNMYLRTLRDNRALPIADRRREVYLDESYIHQHYARRENSVWDPNDEQDMAYRLPHKGRRYCICAAITNKFGAKPACIVDGSVWTFSPDSAKAHTGDYHKNFNKVNFVNWFRNDLLPNLEEPSLIIMDNARYHNAYPPDTPVVAKMKLRDALPKLEEYGVEFDRNITRAEAHKLLREYIKENIQPETVQIAFTSRTYNQ